MSQYPYSLVSLPEDILHTIRYTIDHHPKAKWIIIDIKSKLPDWTNRFTHANYEQLMTAVNKGHTFFLLRYNRKTGILIQPS